MAIITIINKSELNNCFSAEQYTNQCHKCDKVLTCKIKSKYHKEGIIIKSNQRKQDLKSEMLKRKDSIKKDTLRALSIFQ